MDHDDDPYDMPEHQPCPDYEVLKEGGGGFGAAWFLLGVVFFILLLALVDR